jgi:hypothetical protein
MTIMVCCFEQDDAAIVRLYGRATVTPLADSPISERMLGSPATELTSAPRQVIEIEVTSTMTSCGYGVPLMTFTRDRSRSERGRRYKD